jgi:hypothetical protein
VAAGRSPARLACPGTTVRKDHDPVYGDLMAEILARQRAIPDAGHDPAEGVHQIGLDLAFRAELTSRPQVSLLV